MKKGIIISIIAVIVLTAITCFAMSNTYFGPYEKQIRLAYKYLNDGNYEEAILAFDKAIQIDAKKPKAYIGKADVYITRCDENAIADATAALKLGYEQSEDNKDEIVKAVIRLSDILKETGQAQLAYEFSKIMYETVSDERIADWIVEFIKNYVENTEEIDGKFFVDAFKEIYNIIQSDQLVEWLKNYAEANLGDPENKFVSEMINLLNFVYEINNDESAKKIINENFEAKGRAILKELYDAYYSGNEAYVGEFVNDYNNLSRMCSKINEGGFLWYSENNSLSGTKGIALYGNNLLYIGGWKDGKFDGQGEYYIFCKEQPSDNAEDWCIVNFKGQFKNGAPNGVGTELKEWLGAWGKEIYTGNYVQGVKEGIFKYEYFRRTDKGKGNKLFQECSCEDINYINGVAQKKGRASDFTTVAMMKDVYYVSKRMHDDKSFSLKEYTGKTEYAAGYSSEKTSY